MSFYHFKAPKRKHWKRALEKKVEFLEECRRTVENTDFVAFFKSLNYLIGNIY